MNKLRILPQPDMFLRLVPCGLQVRVLKFILARIFHSEAMEGLQPIHGKRFLFCTPGGELNLVMCIEDHEVYVERPSDQDADVTIRGDLAALAALCLGLEDTDSLFFSRRLLLTGDTSTGLLFKNVMANLDFDLRAELERRFGKRIATLFWRLAEQGIDTALAVDHRLAGAAVILGKRFGLSPAEEAHSMEKELRRLKEENVVLKQRMKRRPARRPASV